VREEEPPKAAARVRREDLRFLTGVGEVPELDRPIQARRREPPPTLQERDVDYPSRVPLQRRPRLSGPDLPQLDRVGARHRRDGAVGGEGPASARGVRLPPESASPPGGQIPQPGPLQTPRREVSAIG